MLNSRDKKFVKETVEQLTEEITLMSDQGYDAKMIKEEVKSKIEDILQLSDNDSNEEISEAIRDKVNIVMNAVERHQNNEVKVSKMKEEKEDRAFKAWCAEQEKTLSEKRPDPIGVIGRLMDIDYAKEIAFEISDAWKSGHPHISIKQHFGNAKNAVKNKFKRTKTA